MDIQIIINGLSLGSVYAMIAVGFCLIFSILKFSNFAHGSMVTISAFIGYFFSIKLSLSLFPTLLAAMLSGAVVGIVGEFIAFRTITMKSSSTFYYFVSSMTLNIFLEALVVVAVGSNFTAFPAFLKNPVIDLGGYKVATINIIMFVCAVFALILLSFFINKTRVGRAIRAVSFDIDTAYLMGIDVIRTIQIVFIIAGALTGLSGVFLGINYTLSMGLGKLMVVKGFIAAIIGGLGNIYGAFIGAMILGIVENFLIFIIGSSYTPFVTFILVLLFLLVRPQGIAGKSTVEKA